MIWTFNVFLAFWFFVFLHQFSTCHTSLGDLCLLKAQTLNTSSYSGVCSMRQAWCSSCREVCVCDWLPVLSRAVGHFSAHLPLCPLSITQRMREREICLSVCWVYIWLSLFPLVMRYDRGVSALLRPCVLCCLLWEQHAQHTHNKSLHTIRHAVWHTYSLHTHS